MSTDAFLTGSFAYSRPRHDSDIDLAVLTPVEAIEKLADVAGVHPDTAESIDEPDSEYPVDERGTSLRFGRLNLLCFANPVVFGAWRDATAELVARRPVTRDQAVELIKAKVAAADDAAFEAAFEAEKKDIDALSDEIDVEFRGG